MRSPQANRDLAGYTLIELLCVMAIIMILATLACGPASRALMRVRADQWAEKAQIHLDAATVQLNQRFAGKKSFPAVTLQRIEAEKWVGPSELEFLKDRRVTFLPFAGSDPDDKFVIIVELKRGFWTEARLLTTTKGELTRLPE